MNAQHVLEASGLFASNSEIRTIVKQKGCRINGQVVDDINEEIELGDFLNFVWLFPEAAQAIKEHGLCFLLVSRGKKQKSLLRVMPDGSLVDGVQFLSLGTPDDCVKQRSGFNRQQLWERLRSVVTSAVRIAIRTVINS